QTYESSTTLRYSMASSQALEGVGTYAGMDLDLDMFFVTSEEVLEEAVDETGDSVGALQGSIMLTPLEGIRTSRLQITSEANSPEQAQQRADAVAEAYTAHLQSQVDESLEALEADLVEAEQERADAMAAVRDEPDDPVAQGQLGQALSAHLDLTQQVEAMSEAGPPAAVMQQA